jgi:hypothetical protein
MYYRGDDNRGDDYRGDDYRGDDEMMIPFNCSYRNKNELYIQGGWLQGG